MSLRPDQLATKEAIYQAWAGGARRVLQQAPTAWGKGTLATSILADPMDGLSVFISHLEEINLDIAQRVRALTGIEPRVLMGDNPEGPSDSPILIASEQTIARRLGGGATPAALGLVNVGRCIRDECFPAGTLLDGRPIESIRVGDVVTSYNESTQKLERRVVLFSMRSRPRAMVRVYSDDDTIACTEGHPFFTRRGWVIASELNGSDWVLKANDYANQDRENLCGMPGRCEACKRVSLPRVLEKEVKGRAVDAGDALLGMCKADGDCWTAADRRSCQRQGILFAALYEGREGESICKEHGRDESSMRSGAHAPEQSDAQAWHSGKDDRDPTQDQASSTVPGRQREADSGHAGCPCGCARMADRSPDQDGPEETRYPDMLQGGHREQGSDDRYRGGRRIPLRNHAQSAGCEERSVLTWHRVDRVEVLKPGSDRRFGGVCADGFVYNVEVEGLHTYVAGGFVVHNCHRQASESSLLVSRACGPSALHLGLTATPERGDGRPLSFYDVLLPGPSPADLVTRGLIAPIVTYSPERPGPALAQDPIEAWPLRPDGSPRPGVLFARDIEHSKALAARFYPERGIRAVHVEGDTPNRGAIIQRFNAGELDVLTCFRLFVEGVDVPRSEVTMLACSMSYPGPFLQSIGRSRRLYIGKLMAYLYDLTDNVMERAPDGTLRDRLGMPDDLRVFAIDGSAGIKLALRPDVLPIRRCRICHAMTRANRACLVCGARMAPPPRPAPKISKREMVERRHARQRLEGPDWEAWKAWVIDRAARGKTPQQIVAAWNYQHGSWPRFTVKQVLAPAPQRTEP